MRQASFDDCPVGKESGLRIIYRNSRNGAQIKEQKDRESKRDAEHCAVLPIQPSSAFKLACAHSEKKKKSIRSGVETSGLVSQVHTGFITRKCEFKSNLSPLWVLRTY